LIAWWFMGYSDTEIAGFVGLSAGRIQQIRQNTMRKLRMAQHDPGGGGKYGKLLKLAEWLSQQPS